MKYDRKKKWSMTDTTNKVWQQITNQVWHKQLMKDERKKLNEVR